MAAETVLPPAAAHSLREQREGAARGDQEGRGAQARRGKEIGRGAETGRGTGSSEGSGGGSGAKAKTGGSDHAGPGPQNDRLDFEWSGECCRETNRHCSIGEGSDCAPRASHCGIYSSNTDDPLDAYTGEGPSSRSTKRSRERRTARSRPDTHAGWQKWRRCCAHDPFHAAPIGFIHTIRTVHPFSNEHTETSRRRRQEPRQARAQPRQHPLPHKHPLRRRSH
jgi:hypothetical protein